MRSTILVIFCLSLLIISSGCTDDVLESHDPEEVIKVVTTIYPLADIISELGGERVQVSYLLPAGSSPHTFEPTVEQARAVHEARLFVHVGAGLDDWAVKLAGASGSRIILLDLSRQVALIDSSSSISLLEAADEYDHSDCDHDHSRLDPHFWLDPLVVRDLIAPAIYEKLALIISSDESYLRDRLDRYQGELTVLHKEIEEATASFSGKKFISFHSAWQYFAHRYYLEEVGVIAEFPGQEPSAGWVAELVELIARENIRAVFAEPQFPPTLAESIASESECVVWILDPLGGEDLPGRETYLDLMRYNLAVFEKALK